MSGGCSGCAVMPRRVPCRPHGRPTDFNLRTSPSVSWSLVALRCTSLSDVVALVVCRWPAQLVDELGLHKIRPSVDAALAALPLSLCLSLSL